MAEFVVVLPALLLFGLGTIQSALFYQAKTSVSYATFEAARKGAVNHAQREPMRDEFGLRVASIFGGTGGENMALAAMRKGKTEANDDAITELEIINPTQEAFDDFGAANPDNGEVEIPNVHLRYRDTAVGSTSFVNVQDANLLKIKMTYGYELKVPLVNKVITTALKAIDSDNADYYDQNRIPITAVATVRMQNEAWKDGNLHADGSAPEGTDPSNTPPTEGDPPGDNNPPGGIDEPGEPACPAGTCCTTDQQTLASQSNSSGTTSSASTPDA